MGYGKGRVCVGGGGRCTWATQNYKVKASHHPAKLEPVPKAFLSTKGTTLARTHAQRHDCYSSHARMTRLMRTECMAVHDKST